MKIDLSKNVSLADATPVQIEQDKPISLGAICRIALNSITMTDPHMRRLTPEEIMRRGKLAARMAKEGEQDFTPEDITFIRKAVQDAPFNPEVIVTVYDTLGGKTDGE